MGQKLIRRYIASDPHICLGKPTFCGTRIMVSQVLEQVAAGLAWETIVEEWRGSVTRDDIAEAVSLAGQPSSIPSKMEPDQMLGLAAQVYPGLSVQKVAAVEKIALDRSNFVGVRQFEA